MEYEEERPISEVDKARKIAAEYSVSASDIAKEHWKAQNRWKNIHLWLGLPTAIMAALSGVSALAQFDYHDILAAFLAIMVTALTSIVTFLNPTERASFHRQLKAKNQALANDTHIFAEMECDKIPPEQRTQRLKEFADRIDKLEQEET